MNILECMIRSRVPPGNITLYQVQYELYRAALRNLQVSNPSWDLAQLRIKKIDGYQGGEVPLILLDLVITDHLGLATHTNHLNVAITRSREALVIFGDPTAMNWALRKLGRKVKPLCPAH